MASAEFLEQALSATDVDENVVNAIVGSLENQLVTSVSTVPSQNNVVNVITGQVNINSSSINGLHKYNGDCIGDNELESANFHTSSPNNLSYSMVQSSQSNYVTANLTQSISSPSEQIKVICSQPQTLPNSTSRLAFPAQSIANGCLSLSSPQNQIMHTLPTNGVAQSGGKTITMQTQLVIKQGANMNGGQIGIQPGMVTVPMSVNSSMPTSIPNVMTINKPGQNGVSPQNLGSPQPAILPNVQILNMRPGAPTVAAQKSVAAVSPRVVIGTPQVVGARAAAPGHPGVPTVSTSVATPGQMPGQMPPGPVAAPIVAPAESIQSATPPPQTSTITTQKLLDNTKEKCRNFLANLLDLSNKEPKSVERNVRTLIQELIDAQVEPEEFCNRLERLLNASPQPCLIGFLKKSLPLLRQSLVTKELVIDGISPPAPHVAFSTIPTPTQQVVTATNGQLQKPMPKPGGTIAVLQNIPVHAKINVSKVGKTMTVNSKGSFTRPSGPSAALSTVLTPGKSLLKEREKRTAMQFSPQPYVDDKMAGDDDINDVAAMGGVNLAEETQRILGSTEMIGTQIRSCKDEHLVSIGLMQARIKAGSLRHGLDEPSSEVAALLSHAVHERLKNLVEKLAVIAQHRIDLFIKTDNRYEVTQDVKGQLKFLEERDSVVKKRREDFEREMLLRAAKSRSKNEDPEQAKLKAKAKEMQRAELEEVRQREANLTALQAIGPRKKPRLGDGPGGSGDALSNAVGQNGNGLSGRSQLALRTRIKRINHRDMIVLLEQERETAHSMMLFRSYLK
ncbi:transcription initiation factor TFIID subunit 4 isoform X2 [Battus philenor]|uniref:transcription initiation factor TFIID subunit 4 isoform X2 n=1 Tax=Battus philenor TaxID=42288 RepID=UPI0035CED5A9